MCDLETNLYEKHGRGCISEENDLHKKSGSFYDKTHGLSVITIITIIIFKISLEIKYDIDS